MHGQVRLDLVCTQHIVKCVAIMRITTLHTQPPSTRKSSGGDTTCFCFGFQMQRHEDGKDSVGAQYWRSYYSWRLPSTFLNGEFLAEIESVAGSANIIGGSNLMALAASCFLANHFWGVDCKAARQCSYLWTNCR